MYVQYHTVDVSGDGVMARKTGKQVYDKLVSRVSSAVEDYREGVRTTTKNPMQEAKKKKSKMVNNWNQAVNDGSWEAGLDRVSDSDWKDTTAKKGGDRIVGGLEESRAKGEAIFDATLAVTYDVADAVNKMPDDTPAQRIAKSVAYQQQRAAAKRGRRRR